MPRVKRGAIYLEGRRNGIEKSRDGRVRQSPGQPGRRQSQKLVRRRKRNRSRRDRLRLRGGRRDAARLATMATDMCDADDTSRRCRDQDGRPSQQQAANNGQCRFHGLNINQSFKRSSTAFGFFLSIFGVMQPLGGYRCADLPKRLNRQTPSLLPRFR